MSEKNTTNGGNGNGGEATDRRQLYPTREEAEAVGPATDKQRLILVEKDGKAVGYTYGNATADALITAARHAGYSARVADPKPGAGFGRLTADRVAEMSDEELAALGLSRAKGGKAQGKGGKGGAGKGKAGKLTPEDAAIEIAKNVE